MVAMEGSWVMLTSIATWFVSSKAGRALAGAGAIALALGAALLKVFYSGQAAEKAKQDRASLENLRNREKINEDVGKMPDDSVRGELAGWVRDDKR